MSDDLISRQTVKEQMIKYGFHAPDMTVTEFVEDLPSVNPQEPKTGHWIDEVTVIGAKICRCSECSFTIPKPLIKNNFCSNCGAKMIESEE